MKIVLTGASGSIGKELLSQNSEIVSVKARWNDFDQLRQELKGTDFLIHAGASLDAEYVSDLIMGNVFTTARLLECALEISPKTRVILISSMSILGKNGSTKSVEAMSKYSLSKYLIEQIARQYKNVLSVRFSTIFYKDPTRDGLSKILHTAKTTGKVFIRPAERDFIPLGTACASLLKLCKPEVFDNAVSPKNIFLGRTANTADIGAWLKQRHSVSVEYGEPDTSDVCVGISRRFSWENNEPQDLCLKQAVEDYYNNV